MTYQQLEEPTDDDALELQPRETTGFVEIGKALFRRYPRRTIVGLSLMGTQAFLYNAIFFTFGLMLTTFFGVDAKTVGLFLIPFAAGNYVGPLVLGRLFDTLGRRLMIPLTFLVAGALTIVTGWLFAAKVIDSTTWITVAWVVIFFFASAGASSGYLTVSETFPLEIRAMAIAFFYAVATGIGGGIGPYLYGNLIASDNRWTMFYGYVIGGGLMIAGGLVHRFLGVEAAEQSLEDVAAPLSGEDGGHEQRSRKRRRDVPRRAVASGLPTATPRAHDDRDLDREIAVLAQALDEDGPAGRRELARRVRARYWGPGRYRRALRSALREGRIRRRGSGLLGAP
jgi:MFS family permease